MTTIAAALEAKGMVERVDLNTTRITVQDARVEASNRRDAAALRRKRKKETKRRATEDRAMVVLSSVLPAEEHEVLCTCSKCFHFWNEVWFDDAGQAHTGHYEEASK